MKDDEISPVLEAGGQYVILKREGLIPQRKETLQEVAGRLEYTIRERKMHKVADEEFARLKKETHVVYVWGDPAKQKQMPGVAALVGNETISISELAQECMDRYGEEVLEGTINRTMIEVECNKKGIAVTEADMNDEIARAALLGIKPKRDGSPDIDAWMKTVTEEQGMTVDAYRRDIVWPSAALRKLAGEKINVTEEDLRKGFEANFGPRVRCLAIVLNNQRKAFEVFEKARKKNTSEYFGELAAQYSIEPSTQSMHGEVPPIKKYGPQPLLEEKAFALKPGELSEIIQMGDKFVLLRCEGYTEPIGVKFDEVKEEIRRDLIEKKLNLKMAGYFDNLQASSSIRNFLTGKNHEPQQSAVPDAEMKIPTVKHAPANRG
jgi:parvulin-like peptidyl-prolyl isomerase